MALRYYANAPATSLASGCTAVATSIVVASTTGLPVSYPFTLIIDRGLSTEEAVEVTNGSGTTLTVTRGVDSTTAFAHSASAEVVHGITARDLREPNAHIEATAAHGATGAVVGTTNTQTLTNKTLTDPVVNGAVTGTAFGAWTTYAPARTGFTLSAETSYYRQVGKTCTWSYIATVVSVSGTVTVQLPVEAARGITAGPMPLGSGLATETGTAYRAITPHLQSGSTTIMQFAYPGSSLVVGATVPFTWAAGDLISFTVTYETV